MVSNGKTIKRILKGIIGVLLVILLMLLVTKGVYDGIFTRYDQTVAVSALLRPMTRTRTGHTFVSGENTLTGYYYAGDLQNALVVLAPGMDASADDYLWQIRSLVQYGYGVFAFDPTGACQSEGHSGVGFSQELLDLNAALDYVASHGRFGHTAVFLLGHSRGGYAACNVVALRRDVAGVVSVSGINSAMEAVIEPAARAVGPLAYGEYPFLWLYQSFLFGTDVVNMRADESLSKSGTPALIIHGKNDRQVSVEDAAIYAHRQEIHSPAVRYYLADQPGSDGHTDLLFESDGTANRRLMAEIHSFYQTLS